MYTGWRKKKLEKVVYNASKKNTSGREGRKQESTLPTSTDKDHVA